MAAADNYYWVDLIISYSYVIILKSVSICSKKQTYFYSEVEKNNKWLQKPFNKEKKKKEARDQKLVQRGEQIIKKSSISISREKKILKSFPIMRLAFQHNLSVCVCSLPEQN